MRSNYYAPSASMYSQAPRRRRKIDRVFADGGCLFRCLARATDPVLAKVDRTATGLAKDATHREREFSAANDVRQRVADLMTKCVAEILELNLLEVDKDPLVYIQELRSPSCYAGEAELYFAHRIVERGIVVWLKQRHRYTRIQSYGVGMHHNKETINICYNGRDHWDLYKGTTATQNLLRMYNTIRSGLTRITGRSTTTTTTATTTTTTTTTTPPQSTTAATTPPPSTTTEGLDGAAASSSTHPRSAGACNAAPTATTTTTEAPTAHRPPTLTSHAMSSSTSAFYSLAHYKTPNSASSHSTATTVCFPDCSDHYYDHDATSCDVLTACSSHTFPTTATATPTSTARPSPTASTSTSRPPSFSSLATTPAASSSSSDPCPRPLFPAPTPTATPTAASLSSSDSCPRPSFPAPTTTPTATPTAASSDPCPRPRFPASTATTTPAVGSAQARLIPASSSARTPVSSTSTRPPLVSSGLGDPVRPPLGLSSSLGDPVRPPLGLSSGLVVDEDDPDFAHGYVLAEDDDSGC